MKKKNRTKVFIRFNLFIISFKFLKINYFSEWQKNSFTSILVFKQSRSFKIKDFLFIRDIFLASLKLTSFSLSKSFLPSIINIIHKLYLIYF